MSKKLKRPIAFIATLAMILSMLLYLPSGVMTDIGFGLAVSAEDVTGTTSGEGNTPADTGTTGGTGESAAEEKESVMLLAESAADFTSSQPSGDGSSTNPYQISNAAGLYWFADKVNNDNANYGSANAVLTADITVNTGDVAGCNGQKQNGWIDWTPIGNSYANIYTGTFDGQNHTVNGLYFNDTSKERVGLFGYVKNIKDENGNVTSAGKISNVGVVDSYFNGKMMVGGVCGINYGTIENCYNEGEVNGTGNSGFGGVCGINYGTIEKCHNTGTVSGTSKVGGVCGMNYGTIENCYNTGTVSGVGEASYVGGVCGYNNGGTIEKCHNTGTVSGKNAVGGVCGGNSGGTITGCYNEGEVNGTGNTDFGGVCGDNSGGTITNCYNTGTVSGTSKVGGVCGANRGTITNCYNTGKVSGKDNNVGGVCGYNNGTIANCYYFAENETDSFDGTTAKSATQFNSGEVAYLLSQGCTTNTNTYSGDVWGQDLSAENSYPVLGGAKVYQTLGCVGYSNTENETKAHTDENGDETCDVCKAKTVYIVSLTSQPDGVNTSVANLDGGGKIKAGESTTVVAPAVPGYTFNGWYEGETKLSADLSFVYTPTADVTLTAKYTANAKMTVTINGGTSYSVSVNGGTASDYSTSTSPSYEVGTKLTVTAKGENFAYWQNEAGSVLSRSAEYTFTVVNGATVTAVYNTPVANKAIVNFISGYDQIINRYQIAAADDFTVPAAPTKTGCDFAGWSINGGAAVTENVADAVKAAITAALETEDTVDDIINVKATYTTKVQKVTITVTNGDGGGEYNVNDVVTVTANAPESGNKFSHWTDGNGMILSYNTSYSFYAAKDITLTAVYVEEAATVEAKGTTEIVDVIKDTVNGKISFVSMSTVPEGCKIQNAGLVATMTAGDFDATNARAVKVGTTSASAYRYTWTVPVSSTDVIYVRAYLVYSDKNGNVHTIYGNIVTGSLNG